MSRCGSARASTCTASATTRPSAGARRRRVPEASPASSATATPTSSPTPSPTRCSAPPGSATSASTSPTPTRGGEDADSIELLAEAARWCEPPAGSAGNVDCTVVVRGARSSRRARRDAGRLSRRRRRAGDREGEAGRGPRRARPRRGHRLLGGRHRHERSPMSPAKRGGRKPPPSRLGEAASRRTAAPAHRAPAAARGLGGDQVEGRQAVRELLLAGRRVRELWVATDLDEARGRRRDPRARREMRVPVREVSRNKMAAEARTEAPQGVLAKAAPLHEVELDDLAKARPRKRRQALPRRRRRRHRPGQPRCAAPQRCMRRRDRCRAARHRAVHVTPTVAKAAAGAIEHLPMALVGGIPHALTRLRELGVWIVGLDMVADRTLFDLGDVARRASRARARRRGQGHLSARAAALRRGRAHPADRPARVAQRRDRGRAGLLRGDAAAHGGLITGAASRAARPSPARTSAQPSDHGWTLRACGRSRSPVS